MRRYVWNPDWLAAITPRRTEMVHVHPCPECYEHPVCKYLDCTIEPDLERDDGTPSGSFVVCDECEERERAKKEYERKLINESAQKWLSNLSAYDPPADFYHDQPAEYVPGDVWDKVVIDNEVIVLRQYAERFDEPSGVCGCGSEMEGHPVYDNHPAIEQMRPRELRYLVRHDTGDVVAFDEWGLIQSQPKFSSICGGPEGNCGRSNCLLHLRPWCAAAGPDMVRVVVNLFVDPGSFETARSRE